jgi:hypothetical protein
LTESPTTGEAAEDSVQPIKTSDEIGALKVGSYFNTEPRQAAHTSSTIRCLAAVDYPED